MHSVANLATLQTPLATFFPSKKRPNLVSENRRYCRTSARSCSPSARAHTSLSLSLSASALFSTRTPLSLSLSLSLSASALFSPRSPLSLSLSLCLCSALFSAQHLSSSLSLSLCVSALFSARAPLSLSASAQRREEQRFNSVKHRYYVASLILHASIADITAQLLSLSYVYLISSDDGAIIMIFVQINILDGSWLCTLVLMGRVSVTISYSFRCLTTETVKYTSFIEN